MLMPSYKLSRILLAFFVTGLVSSCSSTKPGGQADDHLIDINLVQVNDVYEIAPLNNGKEGGMARVATVKKKYLRSNPNTLLLMAGDFLSPSVYNSLKYEGKSIRGRQMVDAMNAAGFDLAIFGNHEFDIRENELQDRINESAFRWISTNTFHQVNGEAQPFRRNNQIGQYSFPPYIIQSCNDADGTKARIAFIGLTLPFNKAAYVSYTNVRQTATQWYDRLKDSADAIVAITHQSMEDDIQLAKDLPGLAAILGGHEHDQRYAQVGGVIITKAMANAKSAYIIRLSLNTQKKTCRVSTQLEKLDSQIALDEATSRVVDHWTSVAEQSFSSLGFDAGKTILNAGEPLDGRETEVRSRTTNLCRLIVQAMKQAAPLADLVILNGGSIRVDDQLSVPVTQYDIIRTLPFGGSIRECMVNGTTLIKILFAGKTNIGTGGFLHSNDYIVFDDATQSWKIHGNAVDLNKDYRVALPEFLLTGGESNLGFLKNGSPEVLRVYDLPEDKQDPRWDIRKAVIRMMEAQK